MMTISKNIVSASYNAFYVFDLLFYVEFQRFASIKNCQSKIVNCLFAIIGFILFPQRRYDEAVVTIRGEDMAGNRFFLATRSGGQRLHRILCLIRAVSYPAPEGTRMAAGAG